jgi:hypothetical protein
MERSKPAWGGRKMAWWQLDRGSLSRAKEGLFAAREERETRTAGPDALVTLSECCTFRAPAVVIGRDSGERLEARFGALGRDEVRLDLQSDARLEHIRPLSICHVSFAYRKRAASCLARVRRIDESAAPDGDGDRQLVLEIPGQIACEELRTAPRVPTPRGCGLSARLYVDGRDLGPVEPVDLSACGIRLDLEGEASEVDCAPAGLEFARSLEVELRLGDAHARLRAELRRREGPLLAFFFPDALRGGRLEPPAALADITAELSARALRLRGATPEPPAAPAPVAQRA